MFPLSNYSVCCDGVRNYEKICTLLANPYAYIIITITDSKKNAKFTTDILKIFLINRTVCVTHKDRALCDRRIKVSYTIKSNLVSKCQQKYNMTV